MGDRQTADLKTKPLETKPLETRPAETRPAEARPAEARPLETKPAETKPAEARPVEARPVEARPAEARPLEAEPVVIDDDDDDEEYEEAGQASDFKKNRLLTIKIKMMSIISVIILGALSTLISFATVYFRQDVETRIQENNLNFVRLMGLKVETEFSDISYKSLLMATTITQQFRSKEQKQLFIDMFFRNNQNFVFVGIARNQGNSLVFRDTIYNERFLLDNQLPEEAFDIIHQLGTENFLRSFSGATVVHNASPGFVIPMLGVSLPFTEDFREIVVAYIEPAKFLKAFETSGISVSLASGQ